MRRTWIAVVALGVALLLTSCVPVKPPVVTPPVTPPVTCGLTVHVYQGASSGLATPAEVKADHKIPGALATVAGRVGLADGSGNVTSLGLFVEAEGEYLVSVGAEGYEPARDVRVKLCGVNFVNVSLAPKPPQYQARRGAVRLQGRAFADADGEWLATGATLFWGVWGWQHDQVRLVRHFDELAKRGVDYVRILGVVGPVGLWFDRVADPRVPGFDVAIAGVTDLAYAHGLRVQWTILGGVDSVPTEADRAAVVDRFLAMSRGREHKIQLWEVGNEAWGDGSATAIGPDELRRLAERIRASSSIPVATTAATTGMDGCGTGEQYGEWATVRTKHLDRWSGGEGGPWRYVRQPWEMQFCAPPPAAWTNNEGKGPTSSVEQDADPLRLTMYAAMTWLAGGAGYVYHSGAGIFGKVDPSRNRPANLWESEHFDATLAGIVATRALLPADLPTWQTQNCNSNFPGRPFDCDGTTVLRMYCATREPEVVCLPLAITGTLRLTARQAITGTWYDALTGASLGTFTAAAGEAVTFTGREAAILIARR